MNNKGNNTNEIRRELFFYNVLFCSIVAIVLCVFHINGKSFVYSCDPFQQDYPIFIYLGKKLRGLLFAKIHLYDFSIGLGENLISPLNLYGVGDPLNLLSVFAFPISAPFLYTFLLFLRIYLSGLGMLLFLNEHNYAGNTVSVGAISYAFSWFTFKRGLYFYALLNAMYLFPFILLQIERVIKKSKLEYQAFVKLALLIGVQSCCSFYFLYMQTIFCFMYGVYVYFNQKGKKRTVHIFKYIMRVGLAYIAGIFLSGPVLFITLNDFFNSSRSAVGLGIKRRFLFSSKELATFFSNLILSVSGDEKESGLAIPCFCLFTLVIYFFSKNRKRIDKLLLGALVFLYFCPFFWSAINGFSYETDRWTYVVYFWIIYISVDIIDNITSRGVENKLAIWSGFIVSVLSVSFHFIIYKDRIRSFSYFMLVLFVTYMFFKQASKVHNMDKMMLVCIFVQIFFLLAPWQVCGYDMCKPFMDKTEVKELALRIDEQDHSKEFYREDKRAMSRGESIVSDYYGTNEHYSILNRNVFKFWSELLISPGICDAPHSLDGLDGRKTLESLLSVRTYRNGSNTEVNDWVLPFGVLYTEAISFDAFNTLSPLQKQHLLLQQIVLENVQTNLSIENWCPRQVKINEDWGACIRDNKAVCSQNDGHVQIFISDVFNHENGELYVYFSDFQSVSRDAVMINIEDRSFIVQNERNKYYVGLKDYLVHVPYPDDGIIDLYLPVDLEYCLGDVSVFWYEYDGMEDSIDLLKSHSLRNYHMSGDKITGTIDAEKGWLFFSIPYSEDWIAKVDGMEVDIMRANIGFMAIEVEEGNHRIELCYKPVSVIWGWICFLVGGACLFIMKYILCLYKNEW